MITAAEFNIIPTDSSIPLTLLSLPTALDLRICRYFPLISHILPSIIYLQASANAEYYERKFFMSEINLSSFLANDQEAIAFLYVQNQDLSGLSPEEIYDKYRDAYKKIHYHKIKHHSNTSATKDSSI